MVGVTKAVSERFGKGGIADRAIWFNGFPFLDNKEEHTFGVPVSVVMTSDVMTLPASGLELSSVEKIMTETHCQGFPIVENDGSKVLVGYIGRTELRYAIQRAKKDQLASGRSKCFFTPGAHQRSISSNNSGPATSFDHISTTATNLSVDLSKFIDATPITVHPRLPLETVMELFKKMGPRVILVEYRGRLTGLVTVKDCLKYQFKVEAQENPRDESAVAAMQEKVWAFISTIGSWFSGKLNIVSGGRIRLSEDSSMRSPHASPTTHSHEANSEQPRGADEVELEDREISGPAGIRLS